MSKAARLKALIERPEILVMPGAYDCLSAKLIEHAGFEAVQCTGLGIVASHLGLPDVSVLSMTDMAARTAAIVRATDLPVMADGDTGFGNAVNTWLTVKTFEDAGAAGINIEDQVMPKRCGHLEGKEVIALEEMVGKVRAAVDARRDPAFVINARTDALAVAGLDETVRRGNAYLAAGATMIFIDGVHDTGIIRELTRRIDGPVAVNMVEGGKTPKSLTFADLQAMGVARVSLPVTLVLAAMGGMARALQDVHRSGALGDEAAMYPFADLHRLIGMDEVYALEKRFMPSTALDTKYKAIGQQA
ncbi:isocitrate lyase/PEP mutase family protein [Acuticoccus kandeliae]|uniref:isocitrate lyase/PEP mutase family protein n=1 Tax=Acuticoccus kandeliae TaxID=2073160 RepID=UPI000D3EB50C|nr:oxaloacetate decarboxylase [Acuticoccus kandeliae]